jgi:hypothetical protein
MTFAVVSRACVLRTAVEQVIGARYREDFGASLRSYPDLLVADVNASGDIDCAAGLRFGHEPLFAENYLGQPVELALRCHTGERVDRAHVVEVCHLVAPRAGRALPFVQHLIEFISDAEGDWAIFTATRSLRHLLQRGGIRMVELGCADRNSVPNPTDWGSYFARDPRVMAVSRRAAAGVRRPRPVPAATGVRLYA